MGAAAKDKVVFTLKEAIDLFQVAESTLHAWIKRGDLHSVKIGGRTYITRDEIDRVLRGGAA